MQPVVVDDVDVGLVAGRDHAAVVEADRQRGLARLRRHHERDREFFAAAAVAGPVRQQIGRKAGVADDAAMRAAVGQARHRIRIAQHFARGVEIAVGVIQERHIEHAAALVRQHRLVGQFFRLPALAAGLRAQRIFRRLLVIRGIAEQEHLVVVRPEEQRIVGRGRRLAQDRGAHLGLMQPLQPLGQRQMGDRPVARQGLERVARQFQPEQQPDRARGDLRRDRQPARGSLVDGVERLAPAPRRLVVLGDRERHRDFGVLRHPQHHRQVFIEGRQIQHELEHAAAGLVHGAGNRRQLILAGLQRRRVVAGRGAVVEGARGRKAQRAGAHGIAGQRRHGAVVLRRGGIAVGAAFAHHIDAQARRAAVARRYPCRSGASTASPCNPESFPRPRESRRSAPARECPRRLPSAGSAGHGRPACTARSRRRNCP